MSFSQALFNVIAIAAIVNWIWRFLREDHRARRNRRICSNPRDCERFSSWRAHAPQRTPRQG